MNNILNEIKVKYPDLKQNGIKHILPFLEFKKEYMLIYKLVSFTNYTNDEYLYKLYIKYSTIFERNIFPELLDSDKFHIAIIAVYMNNTNLFDFIYTQLKLPINYTNKWLITILHYTLIYRKPDFFKKAIKIGVNPYLNGSNEILESILKLPQNQEYYIERLAESTFQPPNKRDPELLRLLSKSKDSFGQYKLYKMVKNIGYEYTLDQI